MRMMLNSSTPSASARTIQVLSTREEAKKQYHYAPDFHSIRFSANLITLIRNSSTHNSTMTTLQSVKVPSKMGENIGGMVEVFHRCYFLFTDCVWRHTLVKLCVSTLLVQAERKKQRRQIGSCLIFWKSEIKSPRLSRRHCCDAVML